MIEEPKMPVVQLSVESFRDDQHTSEARVVPVAAIALDNGVYAIDGIALVRHLAATIKKMNGSELGLKVSLVVQVGPDEESIDRACYNRPPDEVLHD